MYALGLTSAVADKIELVTSAATATLDVHVTQIDKDNGSPPVITTVRTNTGIAGVTAGTKITTDAATNHESTVKAISITNTHATISQTVAAQLQLGAGTTRRLFQPITLAPGEKLEYSESGVWFHYDANGGVYSAVATAMKATVLNSGTAATYNTPVGCRAIRIEAIGGGGAGGGAATVASGGGAGGGGGSGGYGRDLISPPAASYTYTVGAGGTPGAAGANNGGNGNDTTFGTLTAKGGSGGIGMAAGTTALAVLGGAGGVAGSGGDVNGDGDPGAIGQRLTGLLGVSGGGGRAVYGGGANGRTTQGTGANASANTGGGGAGGLCLNAGGNVAGGSGGSGQILILEFY